MSSSSCDAGEDVLGRQVVGEPLAEGAEEVRLLDVLLAVEDGGSWGHLTEHSPTARPTRSRSHRRCRFADAQLGRARQDGIAALCRSCRSVDRVPRDRACRHALPDRVAVFAGSDPALLAAGAGILAMSEGIAPGRHRTSAPTDRARGIMNMDLGLARRAARRAAGRRRCARPATAGPARTLPPAVRQPRPVPACRPSRHRVRYQPVTETHTQVCYRPVYQTVMEQETYTTYQPVLRARTTREHRTRVQQAGHRVLRRPGQPYTVCKPVYEKHVQEQRYTTYRPGGPGVPGRDPVPHLPAGLRDSTCKTVPYTVCRPVVQEYQVAVPYTVCRPVYEQHVRTCCYTVHRPVRAGVPGRRCRTAPTGRSTSSTSASTATRSTGRWSRSYQVPVPYTTCRPVYEQHVREHRVHVPTAPWSQQLPGRGPVHDLPPGVRAARPRAPVHAPTAPVTERYQVPSRTRPTARSTSSTSVQVPVTRYPTGDGVPHRDAGSSYASEPVDDRTVREGLRRRVATRRSREYIPGPVVTRCVPAAGHVRLRPLHLHDAATAPARSSSSRCSAPARTVCKQGLGAAGGVPRRSRTARRSASRSARHGPGPGLPDRVLHEYADQCYTTCRMVPETCVRHETRTRCYTVPEEHVRQVPYTTCRWCPSSTSGTRPGSAATRSRSTTSATVPYTTCRMVPEHARPVRDAGSAATRCRRRRSATSRTPPAAWSREHARPLRDPAALLHGARDSTSSSVPYTTCRMVREHHVRYVTKRHCYTVPETHVQAGAVHDLPDGPRAARPVRDASGTASTVPEEHVRHVPYTTCRMVPESVLPDGPPVPDALRAGGEGPLRCRTRRARWCRSSSRRCVPQTTCTMEPYSRTYTTCRLVPVCVPVCDARVRAGGCPTCPPACDWKQRLLPEAVRHVKRLQQQPGGSAGTCCTSRSGLAVNPVGRRRFAVV